MAAKVAAPSEQALTDAQNLVFLKAHRLKGSSLDTYATALHRFTDYVTRVLKVPLREALPPGREGLVPLALIELFLSFAASTYKQVTTISSTLGALAYWHSSKGVTTSVHNPVTAQLLRAIAKQQGPSGVPQGKQGMTRLLRLLLCYLSKQQSSDLRRADLYIRDAAWLVLGFFGFLRRAEIISIRIGDISFHDAPSPHLKVTFARSKTDQVGRGAVVVLAARSKDGIDIGARVSSLLALRSKQGAGPQDRLFTSWDYPNWSLSGRPIANGQALADRLRVYLSALSSAYPDIQVHPSAYGMHSLRRGGGATAAWAGGVDRERIMQHGRWTSSAVEAYLKATVHIQLSVTAAM
jgi:integrase